MSIQAKLQTLVESMETFNDTVLTILSIPVDFVLKGINTQRVGNRTRASFTQEVEGIRDVHLSLLNPHSDSAETIGTRTAADINAVVGQKVKQGIMPISKCTLDAVSLVFNGGAGVWELSTTNMNVLLASRYWKYPGVVNHTIYDVDLTTPQLFSMPVYYYFYVEMVNNQLYITASPIPRAESYTTMWIGQSLEDTNLVTAMDDGPLLRVDTVRVSEISRGQAIPVSGTNPELMWM